MIKITLTIKQRQDGKADFLILPETTLHTRVEMEYAQVIYGAIIRGMEMCGGELESNDIADVKKKLATFQNKTN